MHWYIDGFSVFMVSVILTGIIIPQILLIAFRKKLFDTPDERKIHTSAVPRLGGIAFMPAILFSLCFVIGIDILLSRSNAMGITAPLLSLSTLGENSQWLVSLFFCLCSLLMIYLVGLADDLVGVRYRAKFIIQIMAALLMAAGSIRIDNLHGMLGIQQLPWPLAWGLSVLLTIYITNAINLIDGIDGLASGLSGVAMALYGLAFMSAHQWINALIAFAALGTLVPFFYYNVFGSARMGKKIFMGDTGSLTIGIILSYLAMEMTRIPNPDIFGSDIMVVAFVPLAIPCLDVVRVFVHRILRGKNPFNPDKVHIHHKLLAMGIPQRLAMILIVTASALTIAINLWLSCHLGAFTILMLDLITWIIFNWWLTRAIRARQRRLHITDGYE